MSAQPAVSTSSGVTDEARSAMLSIRSVELEYQRPDGSRLKAVEDLSLEIEQGEFVCIVGPSGCGKSSLLLVIDGLLAPTAGRVLVGGRPVDGPGADRAMVFQSPSLLPWASVLENVRFGLDVAGVPKREATQRCLELIEIVGLGGYESQYPTTLSGGMQQRVNLARALAMDSEVLLMDEPFASLDAQTREHMQAELLEIWSERRKTVVFVTHQTSEAVYLADRVVVMGKNPGRVHSVVPIDLPRPRPLEVKGDSRFTAYDRELWELLHQT